MTLVNYAEVFNDLAQEISEIAESKGFWDIPGFGENGLIPLKLALVHSELSEALAEHRRPYDDDEPSFYTGMTPMQEDKFGEELADAIIRILDIVGYYGLENFGNILVSKIETNRNRPRLHNKRY